MRFADRTLFSELSFSWAAPALVTIVGPSGSGKSTLLSIIAGSIRPSHGTCDTDPRHDPIPRTGWIIQNSPLLTSRTAWDNVSLGRLMSGASLEDSRRHALTWMTHLSIEHLRDTPARRLSGGERQRVAVARALASGSHLVLADEPTSSLDADAKHVVADALKAYSLAGNLVIMATHDHEVAAHGSETLAIGRSA
ncbi:ATP-binding cassette domain-containing protein [Microbacterium sp.]|uniref:ATP-binding cassette domain-containing protein n=1 Tax=Microbacterium sp. TaxID=51671 RepID=UPI00345D45B4